jgi:hypothetical protein
MRKITLTCEELGNNNVTITFNDVSHAPYKVLDQIDKFLKAAGYELDGNLAKMWAIQKWASATTFEKPTYSWQNGSITSPTITHLTSMDLSAFTAKPLGPTFTSDQIQSLTVTNLSDSHYGVWKDWKPAPTMAPLTTESIRALTTADLAAWNL